MRPETIMLEYVQDPGHGWIAAYASHVRALGVTPTSYSYQDGPTVWLEEDCDAPAYLRALTRAGIPYRINETRTSGDSPIRSLPRWEA